MSRNQGINVAMLEPSGWGGLCHYTFNLCQEVAREGIDIVQLTKNGNELAGNPRNFKSVSLFDSEDSYIIKWFRIFKYLIKNQVDILHIQSLLTARRDFAIFLIMKLFPFRVVYTAHNVLPHDEFERKAKGMAFAFGSIYNLADFIITHSNSDKEEISSTFNVPPWKIKVIPFGDFDFFVGNQTGQQINIRKKHGIEDNEKVLLFFGAIRPYKGIHHLLAAFKKFKSSNVKLLVVGRKVPRHEEYFDELKKMICSYRINDKVILIESYVPFDEVGAYFKAADVVVLPYEKINDSGVLRLAFSFEKPIVATKVGIFRELVKEGKNGFLADNSVKGLTDALGRFQSTSLNRLKLMGKFSKNAFRKKLDWKTIGAKTIEAYRNLL